MVDSPAMGAGSLIGGKYRLTRQIGEGAMGLVWAAVNELTSREVAIKLIVKSTPDLRHRLLREAKACGMLSHRNIIEVLDVGQDENGDPFLVMPLLQGETLKELLDRQFRLDVPIAAQIARDVARALAAAHAATIIHRDLKPANIFLHQEPGTEGLVVKVLDFGVSKNLSAQESMATVVGGLLGSPAYMSPEQIKTSRDIDARSDIWSLGVVLFEMLSGRRPFQGESQEVIAKILRGEIPRIAKFVRNIDPALDALVAHCLQMDRDRRMASAAELAKILNGYTGSNETSRIFAELPQRASSTPSGPAPSPTRGSSAYPAAEPSVAPPSAHVVASTQPLGASTEKIDPAMLASLARQRGPGPAPSPSQPPVDERPQRASAAPPERKGPGGTMLIEKRPEEAKPEHVRRVTPPFGQPTAGPTSAPHATTERLDPSHFASWRASQGPAPGGEAATTMASAGLGPGEGAPSQPTDDGSSGRGSSPASLARGGTVKIPFEQLATTSPLPSAPATGVTTSTAPLLQTALPGAKAAEGERQQRERRGGLAGLSPPVRTAIVAGSAALVLILVILGAYALVPSPAASSLPEEKPTTPGVVPSSAPSPVANPLAEAPAPSAANPPGSAEASAPSPSSSASALPSPSFSAVAPSNPAPLAPGAKPPQRPLLADPYGPTPRCGKLIKKDCLPTAPKHNPKQP